MSLKAQLMMCCLAIISSDLETYSFLCFSSVIAIDLISYLFHCKVMMPIVYLIKTAIQETRFYISSSAPCFVD